ncbi:uncharacterized protein [Pagrus major]|uniref:uncharacterized protein n=1 Tax=Pagrus major TaxID=143350 RepID=UPI003CC8C781
MPVRQKDAQRALELLQQYRTKLDQRQQNQSRTKQGLVEEDDQLQQSLDRVINVFQSQLFSALLDIQEYYELTILQDSKGSLVQTDGPWTHPAPCNLPVEPLAQPQPVSGPVSPQASEGPSQPKPLTPRPKSIKSHAPPIPSGTPTTKPSSPTTPSITPQSQPAKVKYRAPLPPVQPGASKSLTSETPKPSSPSAATVTVNGAENPSGSTKTPPEVSLNGTRPQLTATNSLSSESSITSAYLQKSSVSPDLNLVTVSALVSSTIQGFVSPTTPDKLTPTSPGLNKVTDATPISTAHATSKDPGVRRVTPSMSPTSPNHGKFTFNSRSPTFPPGALTKGAHLSPTSPGPETVTSPSHGPFSPRSAIGPLTPNKSKDEPMGSAAELSRSVSQKAADKGRLVPPVQDTKQQPGPEMLTNSPNIG